MVGKVRSSEASFVGRLVSGGLHAFLCSCISSIEQTAASYLSFDASMLPPPLSSRVRVQLVPCWVTLGWVKGHREGD